jgi:hypothetical protein
MGTVLKASKLRQNVRPRLSLHRATCQSAFPWTANDDDRPPASPIFPSWHRLANDRHIIQRFPKETLI